MCAEGCIIKQNQTFNQDEANHLVDCLHCSAVLERLELAANRNGGDTGFLAAVIRALLLERMCDDF